MRVETLWSGVLVPTCSSSAEDRGGEGRWSFGNPPGSPIHSAFSLQLRGHLIRSSARLCEREADSCLQQRFQQRRERESQPGDQPTDRTTASGVWIFTHDGSFSCFPPDTLPPRSPSFPLDVDVQDASGGSFVRGGKEIDRENERKRGNSLDVFSLPPTPSRGRLAGDPLRGTSLLFSFGLAAAERRNCFSSVSFYEK